MIILTDGTTTLTLKNPDFSNTESVENRRIYRKTRGGNLVIFRDNNWPKTNVFVLKFSYLKQEDVTKMLEFFEQTLGKQLTLTDHEGRTWTGLLIAPSEEVTQPGRFNFAAGLQFQVVS